MVQFAGLDQRGDDAPVSGTFIMAGEESVLAIEREFAFILPISTTPSSIIPGIPVSVGGGGGFIGDATRTEIDLM